MDLIKAQAPYRIFSATLTILLCSLWTGNASAGTTTSTLQPELAVPGAPFQHQLDQCVEIAKTGNYDQALQLAKQARQTYSQMRMFDVQYINTLVNIVQQADSKKNVLLINEAITVINQQKENHLYAGNGDAEAAYFFMNAVQRLVEVVELMDKPIANKLRICEGQIATLLKANPGYPQNAVEALAAPLVEMAHGYAFFDRELESIEAVRTAVSVGYGKFHQLENAQWMIDLVDDIQLNQLMDELDKSYQVSVDQWTGKVLPTFQPFPFQFDIPLVNGKRLRSSELKGKIVVVDLWATWCSPCCEALPHYQKLHEEFSNRGVVVVGISMDNPDDFNQAFPNVKRFVENKELEYQIGMGSGSIKNQLQQEMVLPTTIFLDANGTVRYIARGYHDFAKIESITKRLISERQVVNTTIPSQDF